MRLRHFSIRSDHSLSPLAASLEGPPIRVISRLEKNELLCDCRLPALWRLEQDRLLYSVKTADAELQRLDCPFRDQVTKGGTGKGNRELESNSVCERERGREGERDRATNLWTIASIDQTAAFIAPLSTAKDHRQSIRWPFSWLLHNTYIVTAAPNEPLHTPRTLLCSILDSYPTLTRPIFLCWLEPCQGL